MNIIKTTCMALLVVMLSPMAANAGFITGSSGAGGTVIDDVNNQEWLRLDITSGMTIADSLMLGSADGFAWATEGDVNNLLDQFFAINGGDPGTRAGDFAFGASTSLAAETTWNSLFGLTYESGTFRESLGFYDNGGAGQLESWFGFNSNPATFNGNLTPPVFDIGVFLVRDTAAAVPEPGTLALLGLGLGGLAVARRRRKA